MEDQNTNQNQEETVQEENPQVQISPINEENPNPEATPPSNKKRNILIALLVVLIAGTGLYFGLDSTLLQGNMDRNKLLSRFNKVSSEDLKKVVKNNAKSARTIEKITVEEDKAIERNPNKTRRNYRGDSNGRANSKEDKKPSKLENDKKTEDTKKEDNKPAVNEDLGTFSGQMVLDFNSLTVTYSVKNNIFEYYPDEPRGAGFEYNTVTYQGPENQTIADFQVNLCNASECKLLGSTTSIVNANSKTLHPKISPADLAAALEEFSAEAQDEFSFVVKVTDPSGNVLESNSLSMVYDPPDPAELYLESLTGTLLNNDFSIQFPESYNSLVHSLSSINFDNQKYFAISFQVNAPSYTATKANPSYPVTYGIRLCGEEACEELTSNNGLIFKNETGKKFTRIVQKPEIVEKMISLYSQGADYLYFVGYMIDPTGIEMLSNQIDLIVENSDKENLLASESLEGNWFVEDSFTLNFSSPSTLLIDETTLKYDPESSQTYWFKTTSPEFKTGVIDYKYTVSKRSEYCDESLENCALIRNNSATIWAKDAGKEQNYSIQAVEMAKAVDQNPTYNTLVIRLDDPSGGVLSTNTFKIVKVETTNSTEEE